MELPSSCREVLDDIEIGDSAEVQEFMRSCAQNCQSDQCKLGIVDRFCRATDDPFDQTIKYGLLAVYRTLRDLPLGSIFPKISGKDREKTFSAAPMAILLIGGDHSQSLGSCLCCRNTDCNFYVVLGESERAAAEVCTEQCGDSNVVGEPSPDKEPIIGKSCQSELNTRFPDLDEDLSRWMEGEGSMDELEAEYPSVAELCRKVVESELEDFDLLTQICNDCGDGSFRDSSVSFISADGSPISLDDTADSESKENIWIGIGIGIGVVVVVILAIILYRRHKNKQNANVKGLSD